VVLAVTVRVLVHAEDALADGVARDLLDRAVHEEAEDNWLRDLWEPGSRDQQRAFEDFSPTEPSSPRFRVHPRDPKTNRALGGNAALAYPCVRLAAQQRGPNEDVLLLIAFDTDHRADELRCRHGVAVATGSAEAAVPTIVAEATPEFDAWVLAGCNVETSPYRKRHAELCTRLTSAGHSIDPVREPHRLTSTVDGDPRDAKSLARELLGTKEQVAPEHREARPCWEERSLHVLRAHGAKAGIPEFLEDVCREVPRCFPAVRR
jgi:hypothetical protein